jgi:hypothetical protein
MDVGLRWGASFQTPGIQYIPRMTRRELNWKLHNFGPTDAIYFMNAIYLKEKRLNDHLKQIRQRASE